MQAKWLILCGIILILLIVGGILVYKKYFEKFAPGCNHTECSGCKEIEDCWALHTSGDNPYCVWDNTNNKCIKDTKNPNWDAH